MLENASISGYFVRAIVLAVINWQKVPLLIVGNIGHRNLETNHRSVLDAIVVFATSNPIVTTAFVEREDLLRSTASNVGETPPRDALLLSPLQ